MTTAEQALKAEHDALMDHLLATEPSLAVGASATLVKALVLAGASEIEVEFQQHLMDFYSEMAGDKPHAALFVTNKAIKRQYHTYFKWDDQPTANPFFGLFGPEFSTALKARLKSDDVFASSVRSFLELGALRNEIVHKNFAAISISQTAQEVHALCVDARIFLDELPSLLRATYPPA